MQSLSQLLIATSNDGKLREIQEILVGTVFAGMSCEILTLKELGLPADFEENGTTFRENALGKALYYAKKSGFPTLAEDSGILVDALSGELGVMTRRWGRGEHATDEEWIEHFLHVMEKFPLSRRTARFVCCAALVQDGLEYTFEGSTDGVITLSREAPIYPGLPLSSCFRPHGFEKVYCALTVEEKNIISHRGKAIRGVLQMVK